MIVLLHVHSKCTVFVVGIRGLAIYELLVTYAGILKYL